MLKVLELIIILLALGVYFKPLYFPIMEDFYSMIKESGINPIKFILLSALGVVVTYVSITISLVIL